MFQAHARNPAVPTAVLLTSWLRSASSLRKRRISASYLFGTLWPSLCDFCEEKRCSACFQSFCRQASGSKSGDQDLRSPDSRLSTQVLVKWQRDFLDGIRTNFKHPRLRQKGSTRLPASLPPHEKSKGGGKACEDFLFCSGCGPVEW